MKRKWVKWVPAAIAAILLFVGLGGWVVQWLWNWLTPSLFGWREITFWQALGLLALSRILFGGRGPRGSGWKRRMRGEGRNLTGERMRGRCGFKSAESPAEGGAPAL